MIYFLLNSDVKIFIDYEATFENGHPNKNEFIIKIVCETQLDLECPISDFHLLQISNNEK